jgi:hypothetical protein
MTDSDQPDKFPGSLETELPIYHYSPRNKSGFAWATAGALKSIGGIVSAGQTPLRRGKTGFYPVSSSAARTS